MKLKQLIQLLQKEKINTWFDLGLFIDRVREERDEFTDVKKHGHKPFPQTIQANSFSAFKNRLGSSSMGFITYHYSIDGVTVEIQKYAKSLKMVLPNIDIHYISGDILPEAQDFVEPGSSIGTIKELNGFDNWTLYSDFFFTDMERGSKAYNELITSYWKNVIQIVEKLGKYIENNNIQLLYLVNVCSNPGNVALSLAVTLISEFMRIPVINNNHDFYWEGGNKKTDIKYKGLRRGPRDFFFRNAHLGEFFTLIEMLFPWSSPSWINVNINKNQTDHLININGHNPASVWEIGTAVDTQNYSTLTKRSKIKAFIQVQTILSNYKKRLEVRKPMDVIKQIGTYNRPVLLGSNRAPNFNFINNNIVFLQPTRLMPRKRIEDGFKLIKKLFDNADFAVKFLTNPDLKLTFLITGPIPVGQLEYTRALIHSFDQLLKSLSPKICDRVYLGFLFSEFDTPEFKDRFPDAINIPALYNIASLIMLPSETEGRGLPIIESTACGIPIFCRRYYPENVYSEVIGEHLDEKDRLKVLEFKGNVITDELVTKISDRVFFPQNFIDELQQNKRVVQDRFSLDSLASTMDSIIHQLHFNMSSRSNTRKEAVKSLQSYNNTVLIKNAGLDLIINDTNRHYLPGFSRLAFMSFLKSLIDPSYFRVEEQQVRAMAMRFARKLVAEDPDGSNDHQKVGLFYNTVTEVFNYYKGESTIRHDHSFAYRHRNNKDFPYRKLTLQELTGLVNYLYNKILQPKGNLAFKLSPHFFTDWNLSLLQLTNSKHLAIDDRKRMVAMLRSNVPVGYFPGEYLKYELELFVLQPIRARMELDIEEELTITHIKKYKKKIAPVYVFCQEKPLGKWLTASVLENYFKETNDNELKLLFGSGLIQLVRTQQWCVGVHFNQIGEEAIKVLGQIKKKSGFIITNGDNAPVMTDMVDLHRFHIGRVEEEREIISNIMGIPVGDGFIQFVPAGVRTTLAYPTPVQTAKDFSDALNSELFKKLAKRMGEEHLFELMKQDAERSGTPVIAFLNKLNADSSTGEKPDADFKYVTGVYADGLPWGGVLAKVLSGSSKWKFVAHSSSKGTQTVTKLIRDFNNKRRKKARIAWNGGYILNPELVGKLGLPESYIGSPLGLLMGNGKVSCPPLFNKPAFIVYKNGRMDIQRVSCKGGVSLSLGSRSISFDGSGYNTTVDSPCFYDLQFPEKVISGKGRVIIRTAGNEIMDVIQNQNEVSLIPVGITYSIPVDQYPSNWKPGDKFSIELLSVKGGVNYNEVDHAIEAGPLLLSNGKECIDMEIEGWKTESSINTQAARLDFLDMRGPKIAVGMDKAGNVLVLTINGRIRESVGATHGDMAEILRSYGAVKAMGFDPGGSSTLVMDGETLNISPYNKDYEKNSYALDPEPRAVANAIIGWKE